LSNRPHKVTRDWRMMRKLELDLMRKQGPDLAQNLRVMEAMYEEAKHLGAFPLRDALDGLEVDLKIARVVNFVRNDTHKDSPGAH
jgi:hypothetical protein